MIRVLIAEDQALVLGALDALLDVHAGGRAIDPNWRRDTPQ
jgi:hypothetical protein